jgi:nitrogen regulatory protein PII
MVSRCTAHVDGWSEDERRKARVKLVSSLVRPEKLGDIKHQLNGMNVRALTVVQAQDHAPQDHGTMVWRAHEYNLPSSLKMQVSVVVDDEDVDRVIQVIMRSARTGHSGDGHVCVMSIEHRYDICTGRREAS